MKAPLPLWLLLLACSASTTAAVPGGYDPMNQYGQCFPYDAFNSKSGGHILGNLLSSCIYGAKSDRELPPEKRLGKGLCPTDCSSYDKISKETSCCSAGCCRCGGPKEALLTTAPSGSDFDLWGTCSENAVVDKRTEAEGRCESSCVGQGKWPAEFTADQGETACHGVTWQVWNNRPNANASDSCSSYVGGVWNEATNEAPYPWSLLFPWTPTGYFLRLWCTIPGAPWNNVSGTIHNKFSGAKKSMENACQLIDSGKSNFSDSNFDTCGAAIGQVCPRGGLYPDTAT